MAIDVDTVRKVANLAQIREPDARLEALAGELSGILKWIEQLDEVDTDGVEPMTSAVAVALTRPASWPTRLRLGTISSWCRRWSNDHAH
jgi:aspartyl/glutamyl-tRNA(Asn/Gln) amidotransferase C subunit